MTQTAALFSTFVAEIAGRKSDAPRRIRIEFQNVTPRESLDGPRDGADTVREAVEYLLAEGDRVRLFRREA